MDFFLISVLNKNKEERANLLILWKIPLIIVKKLINYWPAFKKWCYCNSEWAGLISAKAFEKSRSFPEDGGGSWIFIIFSSSLLPPPFFFCLRLQSMERILWWIVREPLQKPKRKGKGEHKVVGCRSGCIVTTTLNQTKSGLTHCFTSYKAVKLPDYFWLISVMQEKCKTGKQKMSLVWYTLQLLITCDLNACHGVKFIAFSSLRLCFLPWMCPVAFLTP